MFLPYNCIFQSIDSSWFSMTSILVTHFFHGRFLIQPYHTYPPRCSQILPSLLLLHFECYCVRNRCAGGWWADDMVLLLSLSLWWSIFGADVFDDSEIAGTFPLFSCAPFYMPQEQLVLPVFHLKLSISTAQVWPQNPSLFFLTGPLSG